MIKCLIVEYKRSTFQLGLQARNVNDQRKIITKDRSALFISKGKRRKEKREQKSRGDEKKEKKKEETKEEKRKKKK